jgi:hypothetical protein
MSAKRLSIARVAGVVAWTTASVSWGAAAVAVATRPAEAAATEEPLVLNLPETTTTTAIPDMPESGLMVLRYTPVARPQRQVITEVRVASGSSGSGSGAPSGSTSTPAPAPAKKQTTTTSSGS